MVLSEPWKRAIRLTAQAGMATAITYGVSVAVGLPEISWGIVSALYVVQQSVGATLATALGRVLATVMGTLLGFAALWLGSEGVWMEGLALVLVTGFITFLSGFWPRLRYGTIPAAIIVLAQRGEGVYIDGLYRAVEIVLGTLAGVVAAYSIFPEPAHRSAARHSGAAVRLCGELLQLHLSGLEGQGGNAERTRDLNQRIMSEVENAEARAYESQRPLKRRRPWPPHPLKLQRAVQHLWHSVIMVDRIVSGALPAGPLEHLAPVLDAFRACIGRYFESLGDSIATLRSPPPNEEMHDRLKDLDQALDALRKSRATESLSHIHAERIFVLAFALNQVVRDLDRIAEVIDGSTRGT